jgi:hypothetical protein
MTTGATLAAKPGRVRKGTDAHTTEEAAAEKRLRRDAKRRRYKVRKARKAAEARGGSEQVDVESTGASVEIQVPDSERKDGKRKKGSRLTEKNTPKGEHVVTKIKKANRKRAYLVHSRQAIRPYQRFRKLYGERKYQRPMVRSAHTSTICSIIPLTIIQPKP